MLKRLRKILKYSPQFYGVLYLIVVFAFATIYYFMPDAYFKASIPKNIVTSLYFSTITITTVGYGDMSPVNFWSQLCVIVEAMSGIVIIGFFLNEIAQAHSQKLTEREKERNRNEMLQTEIATLLRHNKLISQNIDYYIDYTYIITTPVPKRMMQFDLNRDFTFADLQDIYRPTLRLTDNFFEAGIIYYYNHQSNLRQSIENLLLNVNVTYWPDLEKECMEFIYHCKLYDFSKFIISPPLPQNEKPEIYYGKQIKEYKGNLEFENHSSTFNPFIALYKLIKLNIQFIDKYRLIVADIKTKVENTK